MTEAAARLALADGQIVHVVHAQEGVTAGDVGIEAEDLDAARELVSAHLNRLAAHRVPAEGQVLLHAADHGGAGLIAEYAASIRATTIVLGAPTHGGLPALMDASASQELWRHARSNLLIINPAAPPGPVTVNGFVPVAVAPGGSGREAARNAPTTSRCRARPAAGLVPPPSIRRRARLASCLVAFGVRPRMAPISSKGTANMSCSTNATRSAGASVSSTNEHGQAHRVGQDGLMLGVGSRPGVPGHPGRPRVQRFLPP